MDKQFQNVEWYARKLKLLMEIKELEVFEEFAKKHGFKVSKAASNSIDLVNALYAGLAYSVYLEGELKFVVYNGLELLDIFIQEEVESDVITNEFANGLLLEFITKVEELIKLSVQSEFDFYFTINSDTYTQTHGIVLDILAERTSPIALQVVLGSKQLQSNTKEKMKKLFEKKYNVSVSQTFRREDTRELDVTKLQNFFIKGKDNVFSLGSLNLEEVFLLSLNNGRNYRTGSLVNKVSKSADIESENFEVVFEKFEMYLRYFINIYIEKVNINLYVLDTNNVNGFETALVDTFPNFLVNLMFHRVNPMITILTAIENNDFVVKRNELGLIRKVSPTGNDKNTVIAEKINDIIHSEIQKLNIYKRAKNSVVYFAETPFYEELDRFDLSDLPPTVFEKSSLSGYVSIRDDEFLNLIDTFKNKGYSHVRLILKKS